MLNPAAFISLEQTFAEVMKAVWLPYQEEHRTVISALVSDGRFDEAHEYARNISFIGLLEPHRPRLEEIAVATLLFGAQLATNDLHTTSYMQGNKQLPTELYNAVSQLITSRERDAADTYRKLLQVFIANEQEVMAEPVSKFDRLLKAEKTLAERLNDAVMNDTFVTPDLSANLTTSRLVALGFLGEAKETGMVTYQINEVLDGRTCAVCRYMHGKTFDVDTAFSKTVTALSTTDPKELRDLAPWPKNTKAGLRELYAMTSEDLQARGYNTPPFHPFCRGFLSIAGTVTEEEPLGSKVQEIIDNADSVFVTAEGEPTLFYHGTTAEFDTFDQGYQGTGTDADVSSLYGKGIYLAGEAWRGLSYAKAGGVKSTVKVVTVAAKNPLIIRNTSAKALSEALVSIGLPADLYLDADALTQALISLGYDSVVVMKNGSKVVSELVVFPAAEITTVATVASSFFEASTYPAAKFAF